MEEILGMVKPLLEAMLPMLGMKAEKALEVLAFIGMLRLFIKPLMGLLEAYTQVSPSKVDDKLPEQVKEHKAYKAVAYLLDWFASIKVKKQ